MPPRRNSGFFTTPARPEDDAARLREVEALLAPQRILVQDIPAERIRPNPFQARMRFDDLEELSAAMQSLGFTSRLRVRPDPASPGFFQLVYGERRLRAARLAGIAHIPCEIVEHSDEDMLEIGLAENIQRQDLNPLEEAHAFSRFTTERGYSVRRLAKRIGKDKGYIENRLMLLRMPFDIQAMVEQRADTLIAARELARLEDAETRAPLIEQILKGDLATASLRTIVREMDDAEPQPLGRAPAPAPVVRREPDARATQRAIQRDQQHICSVLARWEELATNDPVSAATIAPALPEIIERLERLTGLLKQS